MDTSAQIASVIIVEDNVTVARAFEYFINASEKYLVSGVFSEAEDAIAFLEKSPADIVLMDINLPGMDGITATAKIKNQHPDVSILIISISSASRHVFDALRYGAVGYLTKNIKEQVLLEALDEVLAGGAPMSTPIAKMVVDSFQVNHQSPLSGRETEVLRLLSDGKSYTRIADELHVGKETVKTHIKRIYSKLHVKSKAEAIARARKDHLM
ncbi:MAG: response regulator transcription factor [Bacteroidia bacterium]